MLAGEARQAESSCLYSTLGRPVSENVAETMLLLRTEAFKASATRDWVAIAAAAAAAAAPQH